MRRLLALVVMISAVSVMSMPGKTGFHIQKIEGPLLGMAQFDPGAVDLAKHDELDLQLRYTIEAPRWQRVGEPMDLSIRLQNTGQNTVNSFMLYYSINQGTDHTRLVTNLQLGSQELAEVTLTDLWAPSLAGELYTLQLRIAAIDNQFVSAENAGLEHQVLGQMGVSAPKGALLEEFTGTWCGWCTDGAVIVDEIVTAHPEVAAAAIHISGSAHPDAMQIPEGVELNQTYRPSFPNAMIDRLEWDDGVSITRTLWADAVAEALNQETALSVDIQTSYDAAGRKLTVTAITEFVDFIGEADLRLNVLIIEDGVTGEGLGYTQQNYISNRNGFQGHPFYDKPRLIEDYVHNHVLRAMPLGAWGRPLEGAFEAGEILSESVTYTVPADFDDTKLSVVAFVSFHDSDPNFRPVLNAAHHHVDVKATTDVEDDALAAAVGLAHPNPAAAISFVTLNLSEVQDYSVDVYSMLGEKVQAVKSATGSPGLHRVAIATGGLSEGMYLIRVRLGDALQWRSLIVGR